MNITTIRTACPAERPPVVKDRGNYAHAIAASHYGGYSDTYGQQYAAERHPTTVVKFGSEPTTGRQHPTQKPLDLMRWLTRTYTNPGDTVLDCFMGSGSTLAACLMEGRHGVGCELDAGYYAKATARLQALAAAPMLAFAS